MQQQTAGARGVISALGTGRTLPPSQPSRAPRLTPLVHPGCAVQMFTTTPSKAFGSLSSTLPAAPFTSCSPGADVNDVPKARRGGLGYTPRRGKGLVSWQR